MILNDRQIAGLCLKEDGMITPFIPSKISFIESNGWELFPKAKMVISYGCSHFGYDIRLSKKDFRVFSHKMNYTVVDPKIQGDYFEQKECSEYGNSVMIPPHSYALGVSLEQLNIPPNILGLCTGKSTYARCGVIVNITPLEPGWRGHLTIEISNANPLPVIIYLEEGICQVLFFRGDTPSQLYEGKYQNQLEEVVQAKV